MAFYSEDTIMKQLKCLSLLALTTVLVAVAGCAGTPRQESTGEFIDDSVLTTKVKTAVLNDPSLKFAEFNVETHKSVVQLSGVVSTQAAINKALELARTVPGVTAVRNDMRVR